MSERLNPCISVELGGAVGPADTLVLNRRVLREGDLVQCAGYPYEDGYLIHVRDLRSTLPGDYEDLTPEALNAVADAIDDLRITHADDEILITCQMVDGNLWEFTLGNFSQDTPVLAALSEPGA